MLGILEGIGADARPIVELGARIGPEQYVCSATEFAQWREVDFVMTVDNRAHPMSSSCGCFVSKRGRASKAFWRGTSSASTSTTSRSRAPLASRDSVWQHKWPQGGAAQSRAGGASHIVIPLTLEGDETLEVTRQDQIRQRPSMYVGSSDNERGQQLRNLELLLHG